MDKTEAFRETYRQETAELLVEVEETILSLEAAPEDNNAVRRIFRAMHTIKGSGSMFGFDDIAEFAHHIETVLASVCQGAIPVTKKLCDLTLASVDLIRSMLGEPEDSPKTDELKKITTAFKSMVPDAGTETPNDAPSNQEDSNDEISDRTYHIEFCPRRTLFASGANPILILDALRELGPCEIEAHTGEIPPLEAMVADNCYVSWKITLTSKHTPKTVRDVFEFIESDCSLDIQMEENVISEEADASFVRLCEKLVDDGFITIEDFNEALQDQSKIGDLLVDSGVVSKEEVTSGLDLKRVIAERNIVSRTGTIRVASEKLDNLVNLIGELVITQARIAQIAKTIHAPGLKRPLKTAEHLTGELRDCILNIRMIPIGITFSKFRRYVRDMSGQLGKEIDLVTDGAETELDKTVIERLEEPLVHLIRNSIDHGLEQPDARVRTGKPRRGMIRLSATLIGESAAICVEDDGAGLDTDRIFEKAAERKLVPEDAVLSEKETHNLLFLPGFSTSDRVTSISGRGVGMDIVKRAIDSL